jgi:hypothetical protein
MSEVIQYDGKYVKMSIAFRNTPTTNMRIRMAKSFFVVRLFMKA